MRYCGFCSWYFQEQMDCDRFAFDFGMLLYKGPLTKASIHEEAHVHWCTFIKFAWVSLQTRLCLLPPTSLPYAQNTHNSVNYAESPWKSSSACFKFYMTSLRSSSCHMWAGEYSAAVLAAYTSILLQKSNLFLWYGHKKKGWIPDVSESILCLVKIG